MATGFGLPEGVHNRAALATNVFVIPHPCFGIDRFADRTQQANRRQIVFARREVGRRVGGFDQRADSCWRGVEHGALVLLDHVPETPGVGECRYAFEDDFGSANGEWAVRNVGVTRYPAHVRCAPEHVVRLDVKRPLHREHRVQQIAAGGVLNALGLAGGAGGVEHKQRVLSADHFGRAFFGLACFDFCPVDVFRASGDVATRALVNDSVAHRFAAAHCVSLVYRGFQRDRFATAHLFIRSDH